MELQHSFTLPVGVDEAWQILRDLGSIAPAMPGSTVSTATADRAAGALKVKLGPLNLTYRGEARLVRTDDPARQAVVEAAGDSARNGSANARVVATLAPDGSATTVSLATTLQLTGTPAEFGHSVMSEVGTRLVAQFATTLSDAITGGTLTPSPAEAPPADGDSTPSDGTGPDGDGPSGDAAAEPPVAGPSSVASSPAFAAAAPSPVSEQRAPSADGHRTPAPPAPPSSAGGLADLARPALVRVVAPAAIAALLVLGALRRRRH